MQRQERDLSHFGHGGAGVAPDAVRELRMGTALASMHTRRAEREGGGVADLLGVVGPRGKGKGGKGGSSYTPLEQQVLALQRKHAGLGALLAFEVGYKYMFYGEDARTAAEVLSIVAYPKQHFIQAGVPTARLKYHLRRLVEAGHKVGVVRQTETRALKAASAGRSKTFTRALSVSERASPPPLPALLSGSATPPLLCNPPSPSPPTRLRGLCTVHSAQGTGQFWAGRWAGADCPAPALCAGAVHALDADGRAGPGGARRRRRWGGRPLRLRLLAVRRQRPAPIAVIAAAAGWRRHHGAAG